MTFAKKDVTCCGCGWVHFEVSHEYVVNHLKELAEWEKVTPPEVRAMYCKTSPKFYERCFLCGGSYRNFRDAKEGDCPVGCTISPILGRDEVSVTESGSPSST